jgi:A/G-specific adenine glycosylase
MSRRPGPVPEKTSGMRHELLQWYDHNKRDLPWRHTNDPYAIWISEIMLQQTRVAAVIDRYTAFLERFPTVQSLAEASEQDVLALWSGLGYYRRARMLHKAAKEIIAGHRGIMPTTSAELRKLPGIGSYTAAAIASIAHNEPIAVVDGNVERVLCRIQGWHSHDTISEAAVRRKVENFAATLVDPRRPGDFNQAIMELGATVCTPRNPQCLVCPWSTECRTLGEHRTPKRAAMKNREIACALVTRRTRSVTQILLEQRPATNSVMPGLWELPSLGPSQTHADAPIRTVRHAIMQVNYTVQIHELSPKLIPKPATTVVRRWIPATEAASIALTGLARKILSKSGLFPPPSRKTHLFAPPTAVEVV